MACNKALAVLLVFRSICLSTEVVFREKPVDTIAMLHDTAQLNCSFDVPPQNVEWADSSGGITVDYYAFRDGFEVTGDASANEYHLRIESTTLTEEDYYECRDYSNHSVSETAYIYVITSGPECGAIPGYIVIEHEEVVFNCTMDKAVPPGELIWIMNNEVVSREAKSLVHVWSYSFHREESGVVLDCSLQHHTLRQPMPSCEEEIMIDVQYLSEFIMTVIPDTIVTEGEDVSIDCSSLDGNPGPYRMTLFRDTEIIVDNDDGSDIHHTITSVSRTQAGVYKCEAFTRFYDSSENHWMDEEDMVVHYSPDISAAEDTFEVQLCGFVELVCTAYAFPTPTITWLDSDDDVIPGNEENRKITTLIHEETTVTSTLTVTVIDESYYGIYTCKASNEIPPSVQLSMRILEPDPSSSSNTGTILFVVSLVVFVPIAALAGILLSTFYWKRKLLNKANGANDAAVYPKEDDDEHYTSMSPRIESESVYMELKKDTPLEVSREFLCLKETLGESVFGKVVKAEAWNIAGRQGVTNVAVKMLKEHPLDVKKRDFMKELDLMKSIGPHPYIVSLLGCSTHYEPFYIISEYMEGGNLQDFLRRNRSPLGDAYANMSSDSKTLTATGLMTFAYQVSSGMEFLSSHGCIHRDLSARKVFLDKDNVCKVSNFGLTIDVVDKPKDECKTKGNLPVPWMALESIRNGKFTTKSDVWSFGVVLWEIVTIGSKPYTGMSEQEVSSSLQAGYRMPKPLHCEQDLYLVILSCWDKDPDKRPTFAELAAILKKMANDEKTYIKLQDIKLVDDDE